MSYGRGGGEKPRFAATGHEPSPTSILEDMNKLTLGGAYWQQRWECPPGYAFLPEPWAAAPARLHLLAAHQVPQPQMPQPQVPQMPQMPPMPSNESSGLGSQMAAAFSSYFGGKGGRGGRHGEQGEKVLRPKLGPCLPGGGGKRGPPAPRSAAGRPSSSSSSAPSCPVSPRDPMPQPSPPLVGKLFQGLLLPQQQLLSVPPAPLSSESLFQMAFDPEDVGRAIVHAHGEPHQALGLLLHAGKTRIRAMQERLDQIAAVHPSAEASLPMPPLPPSGPHEDPIARPGDPAVAPGRVKKKRLAPRHKRDIISLLDEEEAQPPASVDEAPNPQAAPAVPAAAPVAAAADALLAGWSEVKKAEGKTYYYNRETRQVRGFSGSGVEGSEDEEEDDPSFAFASSAGSSADSSPAVPALRAETLSRPSLPRLAACVDAEQEAQDGERSDPAMASILRAPPERAGAGAGTGWPMN